MIEIRQTFDSSDELEDYFAKIEHTKKAAKVLCDLDQWLRSEIKHSDQDQLEPVRKKLHKLAAEKGLDWDEI